jgi:4-amino-4-deoxy-L-arabinose transferase-like glycosyltransferase
MMSRNKRRFLLIVGLLAILPVSFSLYGFLWRASNYVQFAAAQNRWHRQNITHYRLEMEITIRGFASCRYDVEVKNETVVKTFTDTCSDDKPLINQTVTALFTRIEAVSTQRHCTNGCACNGPTVADVVYDPKWSYPKHISIHSQPHWFSLNFWLQIPVGFYVNTCTQMYMPETDITIYSVTPMP